MPQPMRVTEQELDSERLELLRKRLSAFGIAIGVMILLLVSFVFIVTPAMNRPTKVTVLSSVIFAVVVMIVPRRRSKDRTQSRRKLVMRTQAMVVAAAMSQLGPAKALAAALTQSLRQAGFEGQIGPIVPIYVFFGIVHTVASLIMPWTWQQSAVPPLVLSAITAFGSLIATQDSVNMRLFGLLLCIAAGVPGVLISALRHGGLRETLTLRVIGDRYAEVEHELSMARRIHERLFPPPIQTGPIRVHYEYEPMRQIGGDYLDIVKAENGDLTIAIIDVTGHGVAAALAVHRLHGELKRVMANASPPPIDIARSLNEYVHLTLADERVFATAVIARVSPSGEVNLCIAGHPSPLVKRQESKVEEIESTAMMLGAFAASDYFAEEASMQLSAGETLILYTDGATEAMNAQGRQLGTTGLNRIVARVSHDDGLAKSLMSEVAAYRHGQPQDDILIVAVSRT